MDIIIKKWKLIEIINNNYLYHVIIKIKINNNIYLYHIIKKWKLIIIIIYILY